MSNRVNDLDLRIIAILRHIPAAIIEPVVQALYEGGIRTVEVTLNSGGALDMITTLRKRFAGDMHIGAGTVLDEEAGKQALAAGASFLLTPHVEEKVIQLGVAQGIPVVAGAMTPTEIVAAFRSGCTAVKVFPASSLGSSYLKELQGPLAHIPMIAVGGIQQTNMLEFLRAGAMGVGVGGSLFGNLNSQSPDMIAVKERARHLVNLRELYDREG